MGKRKKAEPRSRAVPTPIEKEPVDRKKSKPVNLIEAQHMSKADDGFKEPKAVSLRFTGSHQICPRCGAYDTKVYKSMPVDERTGIRVQYRRCTRSICRCEFKATLTVV